MLRDVYKSAATLLRVGTLAPARAALLVARPAKAARVLPRIHRSLGFVQRPEAGRRVGDHRRDRAPLGGDGDQPFDPAAGDGDALDSIAAIQASTLRILLRLTDRLPGYGYAVSGLLRLFFLFGRRMAHYANHRGWPSMCRPNGAQRSTSSPMTVAGAKRSAVKRGNRSP
jgi:hypothetical protein